MKTLAFLALPLALTACSGTGGKFCDSGEECDSGAASGVLIQEWAGGCEGETCYWDVAADGEIGSVELELIETGDASFDCSQPTDGNLVCGVWSEYHTDFQLVTNANDYGGDTKSIALAFTDDFTQQTNNQSTLFGNDLIGSTVTYLFVITDAATGATDCITSGHNPSYYASICPNQY
jgi:hypothetical protein